MNLFDTPCVMLNEVKHLLPEPRRFFSASRFRMTVKRQNGNAVLQRFRFDFFMDSPIQSAFRMTTKREVKNENGNAVWIWRMNDMTSNAVELLDRGMRCLTEQLGIVEAEQFVALLSRERFDYTKWQRTYFDKKTPEQISREAEDYDASHPYTGNAVRL